MMKKKYIMPESEIYVMKSGDICIGVVSGGEAGSGYGPTDPDDGGDYGGGFAKGGDDWDDEDDY